MRKLRSFIDLLVALLLAAVLLWCAFLFWGAYSQHRLALLLNESVLAEIKVNIENQVKGVCPVLNPKTKEEIAELEKAQDHLFDTNTVSFLFQFVTLLLVTVGVALLGLMYRRFRVAKEELDKAERQRREIQGVLSSFVDERNNSFVLGIEYPFLYTLSCLFETATGDRREALRMMMADYQGEIERNLELAVREKEGVEPPVFEMALDMADQVARILSAVCSTASGEEKTLVERIIAGNAKCRRILRDNGKNFTDRYEEQRSKLHGGGLKTIGFWGRYT